MKRAATVVPVFFPRRASEPHFVVLRRRGERTVHPGQDVISFGGHKDPADIHLRATAARELTEEAGLTFDPRNMIAQLNAYFTPGRRGKVYIHLLRGSQLQRLRRTIDQINRGRHTEFESARMLSLTQLETELDSEHNFALPSLGREVARTVREWHFQQNQSRL